MTPVSSSSLIDYLKGYEIPEVNLTGKESAERLKEIKQGQLYSITGELKDGIRNNNNVISRSAVALDLDFINPELTFEDVYDTLRNKIFKAKDKNITFGVYPTFSALQVDKKTFKSKGLKLRIVFDLLNPISPRDYTSLVFTFTYRLMKLGIVDKPDGSNKTPAQLFGLPVITPYNKKLFDNGKVVISDGEIKSFPISKSVMEKMRGLYADKNVKVEEIDKTDIQNYLDTTDSTPLQIIADWAKRKERELENYNFYLSAELAIQRAVFLEKKIDLEDARKAVVLLANGNEEYEQANLKRFNDWSTRSKGYLSEHTAKGLGIARFVTRKQALVQRDWISYDQKGKPKVNIAILGNEVIKKLHLMRSDRTGDTDTQIKSGGAFWDKEQGWNFGVDEKVRSAVQFELEKAGMIDNLKNNKDATQDFIYGKITKRYEERGPFEHSNPYLVQFKDKTLDVLEWTLQERNPKDYIPIQFDTEIEPFFNEYQKGARPEYFRAWVNDLIGNDETATDFIFLIIGYGFIRTYKLNPVVTFFNGEGSNGKSTLLSYLVDHIYTGAKMTFFNLDALTGESAHFNRAELYGACANVLSELKGGVVKDFSEIKRLTGGDAIDGAKKRQTPFKFVNHAKIIFATNDMPQVVENTTAVTRRVAIVNFCRNFSEMKDRDIAKFNERHPEEMRIKEHGLVILQGLELIRAEYLRKYNLDELAKKKDKLFSSKGTKNLEFSLFNGSENMRAVKNAWFDMNNTVKMFADDMLLVANEKTINFVHSSAYWQSLTDEEKERCDSILLTKGDSKNLIYQAYDKWCVANNVRPKKKTNFFKDLEKLPTFKKIKSFKGLLNHKNSNDPNTQRLRSVFLTVDYLELMKDQALKDEELYNLQSKLGLGSKWIDNSKGDTKETKNPLFVIFSEKDEQELERENVNDDLPF